MSTCGSAIRLNNPVHLENNYMTNATTESKQVAINDIGSAEDFLAAVE